METRTWSTAVVSTGSTPPILLINAPHRLMTRAISLRCSTAFETSGMSSTIPATTASRTRRRGTFVDIRSVLSSTAALSTEWPSANARARLACTSAWNSFSACASSAATARAEIGRADEDEDTDALPFTKGMPSSSDSSSESEDEVTEPASERSRSEVLSPIERNVIHVR